MSVVLDAQHMLKAMPDDEKQDAYIYDCYRRCLQSKDEVIRQRAADVLFSFYVRRERYEEAEDVLVYIPEQNPERKRKQAQLYSETGRVQEAYKAYEELLFSGYQTMSAVFHGIYMLALQNQDMKKAHALVNKQQKLAELFEMGKYYEMSCKLELATIEKNADSTIDTMKQMVAGLSDIMHFTTAPLYEHMTFQEAGEEFIMNLRDNLMACFCDEETYGFLKDDKRYQELLKGYIEKKK